MTAGAAAKREVAQKGKDTTLPVLAWGTITLLIAQSVAVSLQSVGLHYIRLPSALCTWSGGQ